MARYGPREEGSNVNSSSNDDALLLLEHQTGKLRQLVREIVEARPPQSLPSIVTKYLDVLLSINSGNGVKALKTIVEEAASSSDEERQEVEFACDYILSFMEAFVEEARSMDDKNKNLLGRIMRAIAPSSSDASSSARYREEQLDVVLEEEKDNFTPSFLRHVENECRRLAASPTITKDSARLLETLQLIHLRIMEELGKNLGEGALVLGQLVGYDDKSERIAVLEGALAVRGVKFAKELSSLTKEALDGFKEASVARSGSIVIDEELVERLKEIDDRLNGFLDWNN